MKTCTKCGFEKPESEFYVSRGVPRSSCKTCERAAKSGKPIEVAKLDTSSTEIHVSVPNGAIHGYDDTEWIAECYSAKLGKFLEGLGAVELPSHHDGRLFRVTPDQLLGFCALVAGASAKTAKSLSRNGLK